MEASDSSSNSSSTVPMSQTASFESASSGPSSVIADPVDLGIKRLIDTKHIYPTEHHLSYIQTKDPIEIEIRGEEEYVKAFGINDLQFPGQKLNLCGDGPTKNKVTGIDFFKSHLNSVYESAKKVEFKQSYPLPWEFSKGKFFESELEIQEEKVRYLAMLEKLVYINDTIVNFDRTNEDHVRALPRFYEANTIPQVLVNQESVDVVLAKELAKLHILKVESQFKKNLRRWMEGLGKLSEYPEDAINWAPSSIWTHINQFKKYKTQDLKNAMKYFENTNPVAYNILKKFSDTVHLRNVNPNIGQGFILEEDILKWKTSTFLELLKKTPPKNDCEAYLFYKYLILKKEPNFDYIYDEKVEHYLKKERDEKEEQLKKEKEVMDQQLKKQMNDQLEEVRKQRNYQIQMKQLELLQRIAEKDIAVNLAAQIGKDTQGQIKSTDSGQGIGGVNPKPTISDVSSVKQLTPERIESIKNDFKNKSSELKDLFQLDENNAKTLDTAIQIQLKGLEKFLEEFNKKGSYSEKAHALNIDHTEWASALKEGNHAQLVNDALEENIKNGLTIAKAGLYTKTMKDPDDPRRELLQQYTQDLFTLFSAQAANPEIINNLLIKYSLEIPEDTKRKNLYARVLLSREIRDLMNLILRYYADDVKKEAKNMVAPSLNEPPPAEPSSPLPSPIPPNVTASPSKSDLMEKDFTVPSPFTPLSTTDTTSAYKPTNKELFPTPGEKEVTVEDLVEEEHSVSEDKNDGKEEVEEVEDDEAIANRPLYLETKNLEELTVFDYMEDITTLIKNDVITKPTFQFFLGLENILYHAQNGTEYFNKVVNELNNYKKKHGKNTFDSVMQAFKSNETIASEDNLNLFRENYSAKLTEVSWINAYKEHAKNDQLNFKQYYKEFKNWFNTSYSHYLIPLYVAARFGKTEQYNSIVQKILLDLPYKLKSSTLPRVLKGTIIANEGFRNAVVDYVEHRALLDLFSKKNLPDQDLVLYKKIKKWTNAKKNLNEDVLNQHQLKKSFQKFTKLFKS